MTEINADALQKAGYKEHPPGIDRCKRLLQRSISNGDGRLYFITFREWDYCGTLSYDAQLACDTDSQGYVWATIKEVTIEATESRAAALWAACGAIKYDN